MLDGGNSISESTRIGKKNFCWMTKFWKIWMLFVTVSKKKHLDLKNLVIYVGPNFNYDLTKTWSISKDSNYFYNPKFYQFDIHILDN